MDGHLNVFDFDPAANVTFPGGYAFEHKVVFDPADCTSTAYLTLKTDGQTQWPAIGGAHYGSWYYPHTTAIGDDYEVRVTHLTGDALTGGDSTGVWLPLTAQRTWSLTRVQTMLGSSLADCEIQVEIRRVSDLVVVADETWLLEVSAEVA